MITENKPDNSLIKTLVLVLFLLFALGTAFGNYMTRQVQELSDKIYPNVYLDGVNIGKKTKKEVLTEYAKKDHDLRQAAISVVYKNEPVATLSAQSSGLKLDTQEVLDRAYLIGRTPHAPSRLYQKLTTILGLGKFNFYTHVKFDRSRIDEITMQAEERYNKSAKDALFKFEDGRVVNFRQEEKGIKIRSDQIMRDVEIAVAELKTKPASKIIKIADQIIEPEITLAKSNDFGIEELIGEGKSNFAGSIPGRIHNVTLSASKFNGILVPKGKIISFNEVVGDISALTGYQQAYIIKGGRTVLGDGGGVCQTSTTLFRAALNTGLPIEERVAHAYRVGYYENDSKPGFDATVYAPSVDLKIKNNTQAHILIQTEIVGTDLYFRFYGNKDDRTVTISPVIITNVVGAPPPKNEDDPTLKRGITRQVDFAAAGARTSFDYKVTSSNPEVNFEKTFLSIYRPWQAVFLVGTQD